MPSRGSFLEGIAHLLRGDHAQSLGFWFRGLYDRELQWRWRREPVVVDATIDAEDRQQALLHLLRAGPARHHVGDVTDVVPGAKRRVEPVIGRQLDQLAYERPERW